MPTTPSPAQSEASRLNGARSAGPATEAGKARSALNGVRHGLCGRTFFLLPDEDPAEFREHEAMWLAVWSPARPARARGRRGRHPGHVARDPRRPAGGGRADRPVRGRRDRRRCRAAGRQGRGHEGPGHAPALPRPDRARASCRHGRRSTPCANAASPSHRPRDRTNPSRHPQRPWSMARLRLPSPCGPRPPARRPYPGSLRRALAQPCRRANPSAPLNRHQRRALAAAARRAA